MISPEQEVTSGESSLMSIYITEAGADICILCSAQQRVGRIHFHTLRYRYAINKSAHTISLEIYTFVRGKKKTDYA